MKTLLRLLEVLGFSERKEGISEFWRKRRKD
jgi:hypothetical protein